MPQLRVLMPLFGCYSESMKCCCLNCCNVAWGRRLSSGGRQEALEIRPEFVIVRIGAGWLDVNYDISNRLYLYLHSCLHSLQDCQTPRLHTSMLNAIGCLDTGRRSQKYHNSNSLHFLRRLVFENGLWGWVGAISDTYQRRPEGLAILLILVSNDLWAMKWSCWIDLGGVLDYETLIWGRWPLVPGTSFLSDSIPAATGNLSRTRLKILWVSRVRECLSLRLNINLGVVVLHCFRVVANCISCDRWRCAGILEHAGSRIPLERGGLKRVQKLLKH